MERRSSSSVRVFYPRFSREEVVAHLSARMAELDARLPLREVVLFGSYARGNYTVASDIDLLVVYRGEPKKEAYATVKQTLGLPRLEPHVYSEAEALALADVLRPWKEEGITLSPASGRG